MTAVEAGRILGVPVDVRTLEESVIDALSSIDGREQNQVFACANAHSVVVAQKDEVYMDALRDADLVVADGVGVTAMGKIAGIPVGPHITGEEYFNGLMTAMNDRKKGKVFFFGSSEKVLKLISENMAIKFPGLSVCGVISPPYGAWSQQENDDMISVINQAEPDVLWVGMTAPKQEKWVAANRDKLSVPVIGSIGAVFDFVAGTKSIAPIWMRKCGLEWFYRSMLEPKRVGGRNLSSIPKFIIMVLWRHVVTKGSDLR